MCDPGWWGSSWLIFQYQPVWHQDCAHVLVQNYSASVPSLIQTMEDSSDHLLLISFFCTVRCAFSALSDLQKWCCSGVVVFKTRFSFVQFFKLRFAHLHSRYYNILYVCFCTCWYHFIVALSLYQEYCSQRGYKLCWVQEVTQYWLPLHFLCADSPLLLSGCLPPPPPHLPLPPSSLSPSSITWLNDDALSCTCDLAWLRLVWSRNHQWWRRLRWESWPGWMFFLCVLYTY